MAPQFDPITLDWQGPYDLVELAKMPPEDLASPAVYFTHYPADVFGKDLYYFGATNNLLARIMTHNTNTLAGLYSVPNIVGNSAEKYELKPHQLLQQYADKDDIKKRAMRFVDHLYETKMSYAICDHDDAMHGIERFFISKFIELYGYECIINVDLRGCRSYKGAPLLVENKN